MSRILVLGGAAKSQPLIRYAAWKGDRILLCDQAEDAPCRAWAHEFYQVSTLDVRALVELGRRRHVDGVVSYGSDRMAVSATEVAAELGLPGNPPKSVRIMGRKDAFRAFLQRLGFPVPVFGVYRNLASARADADRFRPPLIVKPVDGAGSTAVSRIDVWEHLPNALHEAREASREGAVVMEEFIPRSHPHVIGGDVFVADGRVVFWGLMNSHRGLPDRPFLPTGTSYPVTLDPERERRVREAISRVVSALDLRLGGLNVELMFDPSDTLYVIEVAARNGGNEIPQLLKRATGVDLVGALVDASVGRVVELRRASEPRYVANVMLHADCRGQFRRVEVDPEVEPWVVETTLEIEPGAEVEPFDRATRAVGTLTLEFDSAEEQERCLDDVNEHVRIILDRETTNVAAGAGDLS